MHGIHDEHQIFDTKFAKDTVETYNKINKMQDVAHKCLDSLEDNN